MLLPPGAKGQGSVRSARRWGQLSAALGHDSADLLIAATALEHGLTVASRNLRLCSDLAPEHEQKGTHDRRPDQHALGAGQGGAQRLGALIAEAAADA